MNESGNEAGPLKDKSALVTGASSGLGRATAISLARAGADVALVARSAEELESAKEEVSKTGCRALTLPTDLAREEETSATVERTVEEFGRIDVLVNAAGTDVPGTVEELAVEGWDRTAGGQPARPLPPEQSRVPPHARGRGRPDRERLVGGGQERLGELLGILRL